MDTRIYGTIGPACCETDMLVRFFEKGVTGMRINLSHSNLNEAGKWIENIQKAYRINDRREQAEPDGEQKREKQPEIIMDLRGPELRIGTLGASRELSVGDRLTLVAEGKNDAANPAEIPTPELVMPYLIPEQEVLLDDGKILLKVETLFRTKKGNVAESTVLRGGWLKDGKSIAMPGTQLYPPTLTESDISNIRVAKQYGITGVMLPFVRNQEDLKNLKQVLINENAGNIRIFAKIENMDGVKQLEKLLPYCDEVVIARGDLGNAMPLWELPIVQEEIAKKCQAAGKPFMIVTQMLASMETAAVPTRAEVSDIFRAVQQGAASVMLTGETAAGRYPLEAATYMVNTVRTAERYGRKDTERL